MTADPGTDPAAAARRRRAVAVAGHTDDGDTVLRALDDPDPGVRVTALGAAQRLDLLTSDRVAEALDDGDAVVRRRAAELAARHPEVDLVPVLADPDPAVIEVAAWACGEHEIDRPVVVDRLLELAGHDDALVRESAVAALGAIGTERAVATIIAAATGDKPAVRRRAVLALAPFAGPEVDAALEHALHDRDWQVRQSAEDLAPGDR